MPIVPPIPFLIFFFHDTATPEIYTLSLHDALPIYDGIMGNDVNWVGHNAPHRLRLNWLSGAAVKTMTGTCADVELTDTFILASDRKSTRLNSSHGYISYAVFCLKKKNNNNNNKKNKKKYNN